MATEAAAPDFHNHYTPARFDPAADILPGGMLIYAGIDEAGYGPMFGPLLVARTVLAMPEDSPDALTDAGADADTNAAGPPMWRRLRQAVCRRITGSRGRIVVNDSKKVYTPAQGLKRLELGVLAFAGLCDVRPGSVDQWLDALGERCHHDLGALPWYAPTEAHPWDALPRSNTDGELAVARSMLKTAADRAGVELADFGAAVVLEDRFNRMVAATRSKAAASFTFVAGHLLAIWDRFAQHHPIVVVDRQSGRTHYRELLSLTFPTTRLTVLAEDAQCSAYRLDETTGPDRKSMLVRFEVDADASHMPVALASMTAKYTRELFMARFQTWFTRRAPDVKPTAGYAKDAQRFWRQIEPMLPTWSVHPDQLKRKA